MTLFLITSCASKKKYNSITSASYDGLRKESLSRYSNKRLSQKSDLLSLCHQKQFDKAEKIFVSQLEKRKKSFSYWKDIGTCYYLKNEAAKAKFYYQMALGLAKNKKDKSIIFNNLGLIFLNNKKFDEAKELFKQAQKLFPKAKTPLFNLGHIYINFGHYKNAEKILYTLYKENPKDVDFTYLLGHIYLMQKKYKKAILKFSRIPKEYRNRQDIANNHALAYIKMGRFNKAKDILSEGNKEGSLKVLTASSELFKFINRKTK